MSRNKRIKTNAARLLDMADIKYELIEYDAPNGFLDGISVAEQIGMPQETVFKTLVCVDTRGQHYVCDIPVAKSLNLKKAAKHFGEKKIEMLPSKMITEVTGYIKGGCSPIGMKKEYPTVIHASAENLPYIIVSGGRVGLQIKLKTEDLLKVIDASFADLV